jgi:hypothetical protein
VLRKTPSRAMRKGAAADADAETGGRCGPAQRRPAEAEAAGAGRLVEAEVGEAAHGSQQRLERQGADRGRAWTPWGSHGRPLPSGRCGCCINIHGGQRPDGAGGQVSKAD